MILTDLYRHPVKSLGSERLEATTLSAGRAAPHDRVFAVTHGASEFDPDKPAWARCENFLRVTHIPALAALEIGYDPETRRFRAAHADAEPIEADLSTEAGRAALADWVAPFAERARPGPYRVVEVPGVSLTDLPDQAVTLKSRASLRALGQVLGAELDPRRFRGNLWIDGAPGEPLAPYEEIDWVGRTLAIGEEVRLKIVEPVGRCQATAANPETGRYDVSPLNALKSRFGHNQFGVLAEVIAGGRIAPGDPARLLD
ncbi:MAG: MOSC domain-containing protein [Pseudomonadota bacterium]